MVIVSAAVQVRPDAVEQALALSLDHVRRSRSEPGCVSHAVHQDVEDPARLFFFERWADRDALFGHFQDPQARAFARALNELSAEPAEMTIYEAEAVTD